MERNIARRDFLKSAPAAAGVLALTAQGAVEVSAPAQQSAYPEIGSEPYTPADYPIRAKRFSEVRITDSFWKPKLAINADVTIPFEAHRSGTRGLSGNVLEAAISSLETHPDPALQSEVEARVQELVARPEREGNVPSNSGFEIAVAWFNATGKRDLLDPSIKAAAALYENFKVNRPPFSGGERDAINCLQLYRATHDKRHLDLAKHYLDIRGLESSVNRSRHNQSYKPVLEQSEAVGHAVNCATLMVSLLDVGVLTGLRAYADAAQRMWRDAATRKMYITGGVGSTGNEGFGEPFVLPNVSAYSETCAVLMFMTLNHRLFLATGDSKYIDVLERGMYNNALSGVSAAGNRFFYVNRLASAGDGRDVRWERASLECCPPNLVRFMASMPGFVYAQDKRDAVYVNLYISSDATFAVGGKPLALTVDSEMPWGGKSTLTISSKDAVRSAIKLRVPGWARNQPVPGSLYAYGDTSRKQTIVAVNGKSTGAVPDAVGYITLDRTWRNGDTIDIEFPFDVRRVVADARVKEDRGRMAIERGPIVYCAEWPDCEGGRALDLRLDPRAELVPKAELQIPRFARDDGRGGARDDRGGNPDDAHAGAVTVIDATARSLANPTAAAQTVRLIPYHVWANRGAGEMSVWLSTREFAPGDIGPAGGFVFYVNLNYARDGWRYLEAAPFDQSAGAKWGCFRRPIQGARGTAIGTGKRNTADIVAACTDADIAASLCASLTLNGFADWFLPSRDELAALYSNIKATGVSDFGTRGVTDNVSYWTSTQQTTDMANHIDFADLGRQHYDDKDYPRRVRAIRAL
jgi:uncharacterized protein